MMMTDDDGCCPVDSACASASASASASAVSIFSTASTTLSNNNEEEMMMKKECHHHQNNDYYHCCQNNNEHHHQQQQQLLASSSSSSSSSPPPSPIPPAEVEFLGKTITITTSLDDAAKQILEHSFAIYKVNNPTTQTQIQLAWDQAKSFLDYDNNDDGCITTTTTAAAAAAADNTTTTRFEKLLIQKYRNIVEGHLMGFNIPSKSKRLFRCFCSNNKQSWPCHEFKSSSEKLSKSLHNILMECYKHIIINTTQKLQQQEQCNDHNNSMVDDDDDDDDDDNDDNHDYYGDCNEPTRKRPRRHNNNNNDLLSSSLSLLEHCRQQEQQQISSNINNSNCPLDYFFYHNQCRGEENNCTIHTDRGLLICVCLSDVPGLVVQSCKTKQWYCPEQLISNSRLFKEINHPTSDGYICIMSGDQLIRNNQIQSEINNRNHTQQNNYHNQSTNMSATKDQIIMPSFKTSSSCIHYVKNNLKRARLSISYELRNIKE